ncbi:putative pentatricopeptide repeat-containing protein 2 mitochondrial isoform 2 [Scophthalmus maximus]|uniref:Pentatricopeptide repeat domain 2 n=3 Tax=Scophthalmus maximus TaxID=52904 RepID=A0A2U9CGC7_SCOMX|nr:pentatricopeptide repeat-containing protein 2, mitochondrial isoform X1 [Scophthalmus maximus]AWP15528.1 putative pentatricopeptide repeat-containing protein 2 mitochondrial isoform 2 [Scophthalmus maximus]
MALRRLGECSWSMLRASRVVRTRVLLARPKRGWLESCTGAKRHLLSENVIKLQNFQQKKLEVAHLATGLKGNFIELFGKKLQKNELILRDELKLLLHLCQSADDMVIAKDAIYRYHSENRNMAFGEFKFGPLFMRLCYELGQEDMAVAALTDESMNGFFNDTTSFNIAIDMLFIKESFEDALKVLRTMWKQGVQFNKDTVLLTAGICYKLNTTESYQIFASLIDDQLSKGYFIARHAYYFAVALALKQSDIKKAESFYSQITKTDDRLYQNFKVVILAVSGAVDGAMSILSATVSPKSPSFVRKPEFSREVVDVLRLQTKGGPHMMKVEQIVTQLEQAGQVSQQTLDDMLCRTPKEKSKLAPIMEERRYSRRTLRPLQSILLSE